MKKQSAVNAGFRSIDDQVNDIAIELGRLAKTQRDIEKKARENDKVLNALDIDSARKAIRAYEARISQLSEIVQTHILKSSVFSGLVMLAKRDTAANLQKVVMWYYENEPVSDEAWNARSEWQLSSWYELAISGKPLID